MLTDHGCPQTPGGRIRALGFARMGARGRRRGPIPAMCHCYSSPVSPSQHRRDPGANGTAGHENGAQGRTDHDRRHRNQ